jgi:pimeloyl-ACP methyl ester carboxylesterase
VNKELREIFRYMAVYILVHGGNMSTDTWNRLSGKNTYPPGGLLGAKVWDGTKAYLESHGHRVYAPTLPDEHTHTLTDHIDSVCSLIRSGDLHTIILVGHSYGGMVITGVAARMPDCIRRLVYIDAALPDPGESLFDQFEKGGVDPLSFAGLEAAAAYVEKIMFDPRALRGILKTYVLCSQSEFATVTRVAKRKVAAQGGWRYLELPTSHVPMATSPQRFYRLMEMLVNS